MSRKPHRVAELAAYKAGARNKSDNDVEQDRYLRLAAEFDNFKKRTARQHTDIVERANDSVIFDLLGVIDDFERALGIHSPDGSQVETSADDNFIAGIRLIYDKLIATLKNRGVEKMDVLNNPFDPVYHEAVMRVPSDKEEGTVVGVVSPGYMIRDRVIRHAKVIVSASNEDK